MCKKGAKNIYFGLKMFRLSNFIDLISIIRNMSMMCLILKDD